MTAWCEVCVIHSHTIHKRTSTDLSAESGLAIVISFFCLFTRIIIIQELHIFGFCLIT